MKVETFEKDGEMWERITLDGGLQVIERPATNGGDEGPPPPPPEEAEEAPKAKAKKGNK